MNYEEEEREKRRRFNEDRLELHAFDRGRRYDQAARMMEADPVASVVLAIRWALRRAVIIELAKGKP